MRSAAAAIGAVVVCAACTTPQAPSGNASGASPPVGSAPPSTTSSPAASATTGDTDHVRLGCDAGLAAGKLHGHRQWGIRFAGQSLDALATPRSSGLLPRAKDVNLRPPPSKRDWYLLKAPVTIRAGAGPITLSLQPDANQRRAWVSQRVWTFGKRAKLAGWTTTKLTFEGCHHRNVRYLGGILSKSARGCAHLGVTGHHKSSANYLWRFGTHRCNE